MPKSHFFAAMLIFFAFSQVSYAQTGTGYLYVYRPTDNAAIISGQALTCTSSCSGSTVLTNCNYTFDPIGKSCTGVGYFTGHTDFSNLNGCISQETTTARALSSGEQNFAYCNICDSGCCITCNGNLQNTNCGTGYNQCETQCGAPVGTSPAGVAYSCDDKSVGATLQVCDATGTTYFADRCGTAGTSCALTDNTTLCRTSAYATGCTASTGCNNVPPGTNLNACANTGQTYLRDRCDNACAISDLNVCGAPSFGAGCTGDESCNGAAPGGQTPTCNHVGNTYFQDSCDTTCRGWDNLSICRSAGSLGPLDGCTANASCNGKTPNTCSGITKCGSDCSYSSCDSGCCNSTKVPPYAEGFCSGGCIGNNPPTVSLLQAGGTFTPGAQVKLNATLQDNDERNEQVNITFYKDSLCAQKLGNGSCTPMGAATCQANAPLTLGSNPDMYDTYYRATDGRFTLQCSPTGQIIKIHNFTLSLDYQDKPMLVNATGWLYVASTNLPEYTVLENTQVTAQSYRITKGGSPVEGPLPFTWDPVGKIWFAAFTPKATGYYQVTATFTDTLGLTNGITSQAEAADTLNVTVGSTGVLQIPLGQSAIVILNVKNTGNKERTYNVTLLGDIYTTSFNGVDISGRRWNTLTSVAANSNSTSVLMIAGREVSPNIREFQVNVKNLQTPAESDTNTIQYKVVYASGSGQKVAPDLDIGSILTLVAFGILYMRFGIPPACRQKNSKR